MKKFQSIGLVFIATVAVAGSVAAQSPVAVTTYHYDKLRTGWNNLETTLTPANVNQTNFGVIPGGMVTLDEQVDAQPLVVPNQKITAGPFTLGSPGTYEVVYVATEANTVYGINSANGAILLSRNLGPPVPSPLLCTNNAPNVGITSTPVIDPAAKTLYLIAYVNGTPPIYQLRALNLSDLTDKPSSPVTVAASHKLSNGTTFTFDATFERQRPGLLKANGNIYAGFGSFCDYRADQSRGWLLGWNASTLLPLAGNQLDNTQAASPNTFFLSSIWMSGYGIAAAEGTHLYFSTGNSDPAGTTYNGVTNIAESVVKLDADLNHPPLGIFTPAGAGILLDARDFDLGSGGVLLLPPQPGSIPNLAVMGGKPGKLYLLNRDNLGGYTPSGPDKVLDVHQTAVCWCGPSYFTGSDQIGRVVTSHGSLLQSWQVQVSPSPKLVLEGLAKLPIGGDASPGFFTTVSSNGTTANSGIIWAVGHPYNTTLVNLYAYNATVSAQTFTQLFSSPAGSWPNPLANANIVPVVANGKVYVAANKLLTIFGILPPGAARQIALQPSPIVSPSSPHLITGTLLAVNGSTLTLQTRTGKSVKIDDAQAVQNKQVSGPLDVGVPFTVLGSSFDGNGALQAMAIVRAKGTSGELWPPDH